MATGMRWLLFGEILGWASSAWKSGTCGGIVIWMALKKLNIEKTFITFRNTRTLQHLMNLSSCKFETSLRSTSSDSMQLNWRTHCYWQQIILKKGISRPVL